MPRYKRPRCEPTDNYHQFALWANGPEHRTFELIRPVVLFGQSPAARARETGAAERTIRRKANRFDAYGMVSLFTDERRPASPRTTAPIAVRCRRSPRTHRRPRARVPAAAPQGVGHHLLPQVRAANQRHTRSSACLTRTLPRRTRRSLPVVRCDRRPRRGAPDHHPPARPRAGASGASAAISTCPAKPSGGRYADGPRKASKAWTTSPTPASGRPQDDAARRGDRQAPPTEP